MPYARLRREKCTVGGDGREGRREVNSRKIENKD
jgi:hypothetical protein